MYDNPWAEGSYSPTPKQPRRLGQPPKLSDRLRYAAEVAKEKFEGGGQEGQEGGFQELELDQVQVPQKETT